jgi:HlyD family secretion protein
MDFKEEELEKIELRSNEVQEILSRPPKWIVRWGISIVFFVIIVIIGGSSFFKYPDIVSATIVLTTENPPAPIIAKSSGKIQNLFVVDNQSVSKDQMVGIIENPANYKHIEKLKVWLEDIYRCLKDKNELRSLNEELVLGDVQSVYANLTKNIDEYNRIIKLDYHDKKIHLYRNELMKYDEYLENLKDQKQLLNEECDLSQRQYGRDSSMHSQDLISDSDFEKSQSLLISKKYSYEQTKTSITTAELQVENLHQNILELELQKEKQLSNQLLLIEESLENVQSSIDRWYYQYVLIASTDGNVTFNRFWNENQTVKAGETVLTVIPEDEGEIIGKVQLDFKGAGKVKAGQLANIQFANYPYMEFGMVRGEVISISLAPDNDFYTAQIKLRNGLKTFYDIELDFKQEMKGSAEIITEDLSLLRRIVRPINFMLKKNTKIGD